MTAWQEPVQIPVSLGSHPAQSSNTWGFALSRKYSSLVYRLGFLYCNISAAVQDESHKYLLFKFPI